MTEQLQQAMVLCTMASGSNCMPPTFFTEDEKSNVKVCYKILRYKVLP